MAVTVLVNAFVAVNGVTLSSRGNKITVKDSRDKVTTTGFGSTNNTYAKGLGDASIEVVFFQDMAASNVYATLQPLLASTSGVNVEVRADAGSRSATNPAFFLASASLFDFTGLDAGVGEASQITGTFENMGTAGMTYLTS